MSLGARRRRCRSSVAAARHGFCARRGFCVRQGTPTNCPVSRFHACPEIRYAWGRMDGEGPMAVRAEWICILKELAHHETPYVPQGRRCRRRNHTGGGARDRAIGARDQVAPDLEFSEIARHDLRHGADLCQIRGRRHRQQVSDPDFCRRRDRARPAGARCGELRDRRDGADAALLLHRQGARVGLCDRRAVRHEPSPPAFLVDVRRRRRAGATRR